MVKVGETIENYLDSYGMQKQSRMNTWGFQKMIRNKEDVVGFNGERKPLDEVDDNNGFGTLVPITLDFETEGKRKELFLVDKNEAFMTQESFIKTINEDNILQQQQEDQLLSSLKRQMNQSKVYKPIEGEFLRRIKLNIRIGNVIINDQFDWDINNPKNSPEDFAETICADMGLNADFLLPISHSIRQQILDHQKILHTDKRSQYLFNLLHHEGENELSGTFLRLCNTPLQVEPGIQGRSTVQKTAQWNPSIQQISDSEVAKYEKQEERKTRYEKRKSNLIKFK
jgi:SWI/SNF-related matrix-associated actin-dependent regulator of chromatin subfamily B member 1